MLKKPFKFNAEEEIRDPTPRHHFARWPSEPRF
jgi:hypothetical protein